MVIGVIDIGTNTTRLLVAEVEAGTLRPLVERRHFVAPANDSAAALAELVSSEAGIARRSGAEEVLVVATAGLRDAGADPAVPAACKQAGIEPPRVLSAAEEAQLAFLGATACEPGDLPERVAVVDVGGGSTEIAVGTRDGAVEWSGSAIVGSRSLTDEILASDPPGPEELAAARSKVARQCAALDPPPAESVVAVGGGATSLRRLCGPELDRRSIERHLERLCSGRSPEVAAMLELAPQRVRLLPAALLIFEGLCEIVGEPMRIAHGGMREGLALTRGAQLAATGSAR